MSRVQFPEVSWAGERVKVRVWHPARHVVANEIIGHLNLEAARAVMGGIDRALNALGADEKVTAFNDWQAMEGYDSDARLALTEWVLKERRKFVQVHVLVKSKLVAMGVSVANLAVGGILVSHNEAKNWREALHAASSRQSTLETARAANPSLPLAAPPPPPPKVDRKR